MPKYLLLQVPRLGLLTHFDTFLWFSVFGAPKAGAGMWASCIRLMNPINGNTLQVINLDQNDAAMSVSLCKFPHMDPSSTFCLVGVAKDYQLSPRSVGGGSIHVYRIIHGGQVKLYCLS